MSALSRLVGNPNPWPSFTDKFPVKVKDLSVSNDGPSSPLTAGFLQHITNDIKEAGDHLQGRTAAKCLMTRWDMHNEYTTFRVIGSAASEVAHRCPVATKTDTEGNALSVPLFIKDSWGLVYVKGNETKEHNHWPSLWSYTFCVNACENCAPLVFPTCVNGYEVKPKTAQLIVFPAWIKHEVPVHKCNHERIMVAGNLNVGQDKKDAS